MSNRPKPTLTCSVCGGRFTAVIPKGVKVTWCKCPYCSTEGVK